VGDAESSSSMVIPFVGSLSDSKECSGDSSGWSWPSWSSCLFPLEFPGKERTGAVHLVFDHWFATGETVGNRSLSPGCSFTACGIRTAVFYLRTCVVHFIPFPGLRLKEQDDYSMSIRFPSVCVLFGTLYLFAPPKRGFLWLSP